MRPAFFYYQNVKNIIAAFGTIFSDVSYINDYDQEILVPLHYSPREKFIEFTQVKYDYDGALDTDTTLPRMGFELISVDYDSTRMLNPMSRMMHLKDSSPEFMFNRIPYNFAFNLYIATRKFEDSLKIIEQIIPFFTPDLNITIKDKEDFGISTDVPVILNNTSFNIDWQGNFETRRTVQWDLSFTAEAYLYSNVREQSRIKETIVKMSNEDFSKVYESLISEVEPRSANKDDPHTIIDQIINGLPPSKMTLDFLTGEELNVETDSDENYTPLQIREMITGSILSIVSMKNSL